MFNEGKSQYEKFKKFLEEAKRLFNENKEDIRCTKGEEYEITYISPSFGKETGYERSFTFSFPDGTYFCIISRRACPVEPLLIEFYGDGEFGEFFARARNELWTGYFVELLLNFCEKGLCEEVV